jgi:hypothetical protein
MAVRGDMVVGEVDGRCQCGGGRLVIGVSVGETCFAFSHGSGRWPKPRAGAAREGTPGLRRRLWAPPCP